MDTNQLLEGVRLPPVHAKNVPLICELLGIKTVEDVLGHGETWAAMIRGPSWDLCSRGRLSAAEAAIAWQLLRDVAARTSASPSASTRLTPTVLGSGDMAPSSSRLTASADGTSRNLACSPAPGVHVSIVSLLLCRSAGILNQHAGSPALARGGASRPCGRRPRSTSWRHQRLGDGLRPVQPTPGGLHGNRRACCSVASWQAGDSAVGRRLCRLLR
jgi:hypothetical protein